MDGLLAFAFVAGLLSPLNPCGAALLPAFLTYALGDTGAGRGPAAGLVRGLRFGVQVAAGFAGVYLLAGLLAAAGLRVVIQAAPVVAVLTGGTLVVFGIRTLVGRAPKLSGARPPAVRRPGPVTFGAGYALGSLSCTIGVLLSVIGQALATPDVARLLTVFAAYVAGAFTLLIALAVGAAGAGDLLGGVLRRVTRHAGLLTGVTLLAAGAWLIVYWAPVVAGGTPAGALMELVDPAAETLTVWLHAHAGPVVAVAVGLIVVGCATAVLTARRERYRERG